MNPPPENYAGWPPATRLSRAVDELSHYMPGHGDAVGYLLAMMGRQEELPEESIACLRMLGLLHDVGKVLVSQSILAAPRRLRPPEIAEMMTHSARGEEIVRAAGYGTLAPLVRHVHERWDGHGYPDGIAAEAIPWESRWCCVADAFNAMTSDRPHRRALTPRTAFDELRRCSGTQFDPVAVGTLIAVGTGQ